MLYDFVEEIGFDRLGVFTYSEEEGTHGATLVDDVSKDVKTDRMDAIMLLQQGINLEKNIARVGTKERVLVDMHTEDGTSVGRSYRDAPEVDNFIRIDEKLPIGEFVDVKIMEAFEYDVTGESLAHEPETV